MPLELEQQTPEKGVSTKSRRLKKLVLFSVTFEQD
jgi:hypothetical protein